MACQSHLIFPKQVQYPIESPQNPQDSLSVEIDYFKLGKSDNEKKTWQNGSKILWYKKKQPALAEQSCKWHTYLMLQQSRKPIFLQQVARMMLLAKLNLSLPSWNSINVRMLKPIIISIL
jgi:hypothetical protein